MQARNIFMLPLKLAFKLLNILIVHIHIDYCITIIFNPLVPHIGHLYTAVLADAAHRWKCMVGGASGCVLSTGTDEHGIKIQQAAAKRGCTPQAHCDEISPKFEVIKNYKP